MGWSMPLISSCRSTAPAPEALASTSSLNGNEKSGAASTGALHKSAFTLSKAS
uniref:Uncharacterized protein n=1 Tax=Anguilla anguilla TaxID=7936 RepID=A0A0E9UQ09_ANGAN